MFATYLKLAIRLLIRNPFFAFLNVLGLSVGMAVFFVLWQYSQNELKSDQFHRHHDRIGRVGFVWEWTDDNINWVETKFGTLWPETMVRIGQDFPEVEAYTRVFHPENFTPEHIPAHGKIMTLQSTNVRGEKISFRETGIVYADANLFEFFSFPLLKGQAETVLRTVNGVVLSQSAARKYFGDQDPLGKILTLNNDISLAVTGVFKDLPKNTHLDFSIVISSEGIQKYINRPSAARSGPYCYVRLKKNIPLQTFQKQLNGLSKLYLQEKVPPNQRHMVKPSFHITPIEEIPFTLVIDDYFPMKSKSFLNTLVVISLSVLLMAWLNYANLTLSANLKRMKEIALRKNAGAKLKDVIIQFTLESFLINIFALSFAITLVQLTSEVMNRFFGIYLVGLDDLSFVIIVFALATFTLGSLITGIVPALLSVNKTPRSLFNAWKADNSPSSLKNLLLVFQFSIATILIVWIYAISLQLNAIMKANIGLDYENALVVDLPVHRKTNFEEDTETLLDEVKRLSDIDNATIYSSIMGDANAGYTNACVKRTRATNTVCLETNGGVDETFIPFFNIQIIAGRNFAPDATNKQEVILSKRAVERMGITNVKEAVGMKILVNQNHWAVEQFTEAEVIGVIDDYYNRALLSKSQNLFGIMLTFKHFLLKENKPHRLAFRTKGGASDAISSVERIFKFVFPGEIYHLYFLNNQINRLYANERISRNQIMLLTAIAIGIACLGLLGMVQYQVIQKTKELGIRKALGASSYDLAAVLLGNAVRQIFLSTLIAIPVAIYLVGEYVQNFQVRIEMSIMHYLFPVATLVMILFCTVLSVLWKATRSNPVDALRYE